jgi:subtilisin family serine protease
VTDTSNQQELRPAWSRESLVLRLEKVETIEELSREWAWGDATGEGVRVAVVDSGIDHTHPALEGCVEVDEGVVVLPDEEGTPQIVQSVEPDAFGHGTACTGIIHSIAPKARVTSVKVLGASLTSTSDIFVAGLRWAVEQGFDVINLSLGSRKREWALAFHEVCDEAYFKGAFLVTAANNINRVTYPSLFASVASVASHTGDDSWRFHYNPEPPTEFLARGINVPVPWLDHGTLVTTGNSFAAPHISGLAALIKSKHPELQPFQLKTVLWATANNVQEAQQRGGPVTTGEAAGRYTKSLKLTGALNLSPRSTMSLRALHGPGQ